MTPPQESLLFHLSLGEAIANWAYVEMDLRHLIAACGHEESRHLLAVGFFSIENFRSKLTYTDNILTERFHAAQHYARWPVIKDRIDALSRKRNRLAHHAVMCFTHGKPGRRFALINWAKEEYAAPSRARVYKVGDFGPPADSLCLSDLMVAKLEFEDLSESIRNLRLALTGQPERKSTALPSNAIRAPSHSALLKKLKTLLSEA